MNTEPVNRVTADTNVQPGSLLPPRGCPFGIGPRYAAQQIIRGPVIVIDANFEVGLFGRIIAPPADFRYAERTGRRGEFRCNSIIIQNSVAGTTWICRRSRRYESAICPYDQCHQLPVIASNHFCGTKCSIARCRAARPFSASICGVSELTTSMACSC